MTTSLCPYVLGVDAGGTSTRCWAVSLQGELLGVGLGGPGNLFSVGVQGLVNRICDLVNTALAGRIGMAEVLCLGAAGVGRTNEVEKVYSALVDLQLAKQLVIENDGFISLYAGTLGKPGVAVISGTGSIAVGINARGERARAGGWGYLLGDEGSGYDISRQAILAILRAHDGRGPAVTFASTLLAQLDLATPEDLVDLFYHRGIGKEKIASLAPFVFEAAQSDPVAAQIVQKAAVELTKLALAVRKRLALSSAEPVVMAGGMFKNTHLREQFRQEMAKYQADTSVIALPWEAALGAVFMALHRAGVDCSWDEAHQLADQIGLLKER